MAPCPTVGDVEPSLEAELISRTQAGDTAAYAELVRRYQDRVYGLCLRMCGNAADAEDHAQEAFVRAFTSLQNFDGRARFYTWLFRIAVNVTLSERRKSARRPMTFVGDYSHDDSDGRPRPDALQTAAIADENPQMDADRREQTGLVLTALATLDDDQRCIITLRDMQSLNYDEIAEVMSIPLGTVKSRLHRARLALREKLAPLMGD